MKKSLFIFVLSIFISISFANADIVRNLKLGSTGSDVKDLQILLNKDPETSVATVGVGSSGYESQYFGSLTKAAVLKFQTKYADEVLYPIGLSFATGVVGPRTREKLNKLFLTTTLPAPETNIVLPVEVPKINTISPSIINSATQIITISGSGFSEYGNSIIVASDSDKSIGYYNSPDGKTISFFFIPSFTEKIKSQLAAYKETSIYQDLVSSFIANTTGENITTENGTTYARAIILVKNSGGTSNPINIKIDIKSFLQ